MNKNKNTKLLVVALIFLILGGVAYLINNDSKETIKKNEGLIVYTYVNFREEPALDGKIIDTIYLGDVVEIIEKTEKWYKIKFEGTVGYVIDESVSMKRVMFDVSDFNWGSEYGSIEEFKEFTKRAQESCKFAGYYVQVSRSKKVNSHWQEIVKALDEMKVPYGLYMYPSGSTEESFKVEYAIYQEALEGMNLKYNKYPFMLDLENGTDQTEVLEYVKSIYQEEFIVYANADAMKQYGYYESAPQYWVAHYGIKNNIPPKEYAAYEEAADDLEPSLWQYTNKGCETLFGTNHLDINIVEDEWYERYN